MHYRECHYHIRTNRYYGTNFRIWLDTLRYHDDAAFICNFLFPAECSTTLMRVIYEKKKKKKIPMTHENIVAVSDKSFSTIFEDVTYFYINIMK